MDEVQRTDGLKPQTMWRREHPRRRNQRLETERYVVDNKGEGIYEDVVKWRDPNRTVAKKENWRKKLRKGRIRCRYL